MNDLYQEKIRLIDWHYDDDEARMPAINHPILCA